METEAVCIKCGKTSACLQTSWGRMCRPCFHAALKMPDTGGTKRLFTLPEPGQRVFVVREPPGTFITMDRTLYAFDRKEDAEEIAAGLRKGYKMPDVYVEEVAADVPLSYVLKHPELRMIGVKEKIARDGPLNSDEIEQPKL